jgi:hypothetical protein
VSAHVGASAFGGAALTHGFQVAFYALAGIAAVGALLSALLLEPKPPQDQVEVAPEAALELEAAA